MWKITAFSLLTENTANNQILIQMESCMCSMIMQLWRFSKNGKTKIWLYGNNFFFRNVHIFAIYLNFRRFGLFDSTEEPIRRRQYYYFCKWFEILVRILGIFDSYFWYKIKVAKKKTNWHKNISSTILLDKLMINLIYK